MATGDLARTALAWLGTYALHSTLFLAATWALCAWRPPRSLRLRERLWKLALIGGIASSSLQVSFRMRPLFGGLVWEAVETRVASTHEETAGETGATATEALHPAVRAPAAPPSARPPAPPPPEELDPRPSPSVTGLASARRPQPSSGTLAPPLLRSGTTAPAGTGASPDRVRKTWELPREWLARIPLLVVGGWWALGCLGLLGLVGSWAVVRRALLGRRPIHEGPLPAMLERLRAQAGIRARVRLSLSTRLSAPISLGIFRPEICVPPAVLELSPAQQEALLAHELAHASRADPAWFGLFFLIEKLLFIQPLNRVARRQLLELAEVACDDLAVRWTGARLALASCLTEVAQWILGNRERRLALPGLAGSRSRLGRRIERLLDDRRSPGIDPRSRWWPAVAASSLGFFVLAVPGVSAAKPAPAAEPLTRLPPSGPPELRAPALSAPPERDFGSEQRILSVELGLLDAEVTELRSEIARSVFAERFAGALAAIEERMSELRSQHDRAQALIERLQALSTTSSTPDSR